MTRLVPLLLLVLMAAPLASALDLHVVPQGDAPAPPASLGELPSVVHAAPSALAAPASSNGYDITFVCPAVSDVALDVQRQGCPNRVVDPDDSLGNPALAVDPVVPGRAAFASLHGQPSRGSPPTPLAREGQTHTTFSTLALDQQWQDQPYTPPQTAFQDASRIMGLDDDALIDQQRTLHIASLYAWTPNGGSTVLNYTVVLWKFDQELRTGSGQGLTQADYELVNAAFHNRLPGSVIDNIWLREDAAQGVVYLFWHEHAGANSTLFVKGVGNVTSWVSGAVTSADAVSPWSRLPDTMLLAPCPIASNPVLVDGRIVFACEAGVQGEPLLGLKDGEIMMRAIEPATGTTSSDGKAPLVHGAPRLVASSRGTLALATVRAVYDNGTTPANLTPNDSAGAVNVAPRSTVVAQIATQRSGESWSSVHDFGGKIHNASLSVRAARFTAGIYSDQTDTVHLVYLEDTVSNQSARTAPRWTKQLLVVDPLGGVVLDMDLKIHPTSEAGRVPSSVSDAYGDTRDSLIRVAGREYIAFNDYAVIVYAQVVEHDTRIQPVVEESVPPIPEPLPVASASGIATATGVGLGASAAVGAGALVARRMALAAGQGKGKR